MSYRNHIIQLTPICHYKHVYIFRTHCIWMKPFISFPIILHAFLCNIVHSCNAYCCKWVNYNSMWVDYLYLVVICLYLSKCVRKIAVAIYFPNAFDYKNEHLKCLLFRVYSLSLELRTSEHETAPTVLLKFE